ncbi:hypothetical protein GWK47_020967 [Chionoecetes opilio]|uniref:Uncharacterized protein n=1 Tax=Chionoecetes opilio TaxID=41210 RepID=A0A8J5CI55_CHIOP|nr:hypothetical protein GWK47_020967 [Chionoecetes opilio]
MPLPLSLSSSIPVTATRAPPHPCWPWGSSCCVMAPLGCVRRSWSTARPCNNSPPSTGTAMTPTWVRTGTDSTTLSPRVRAGSKEPRQEKSLATMPLWRQRGTSTTSATRLATKASSSRATPSRRPPGHRCSQKS